MEAKIAWGPNKSGVTGDLGLGFGFGLAGWTELH